MIVSFPGTCWMFEVCHDIPKGDRFPIAHVLASDSMLTAPINLKTRDMLLIDLRRTCLEVVERDGIAVWRAGWLN